MDDRKERDIMNQAASPPARLQEISSSSGPWLHAWYDPMAHLRATSSRIATVDITNDGNHALLVVDDSKRLKVFRGMNLISSHKLLDHASCLSVFYPSNISSSLPAVGVATGSNVYIYRSMRPYFKFSLPTIPLNSSELNIWNSCRCDDISIEETLNLLKKLHFDNELLTFRTMFILSINDRVEQLKYIESYKPSELIMNTCITCMTSIKKEEAQSNSVSSLIIGTENNDIIFLDSAGALIKKTIRIPSVPFILSVIGLLSIDYRLIIATRASKIYTIRNGKLLGNNIELESNITAMTAFNKSIIVSCLNKTLYSYHIKGNNVKLWSLYFKHNITAIEAMIGNKFQGENIFLIGFQNGNVAMYRDNVLLYLLELNESPITALKFGKYGREECTLIILNLAGCLNIKIMSRRCDLSKIRSENKNHSVADQDIPLNLPAITQLYLDQENREKENAESMHKIWQQEIVKFRLKINNRYINTLKKNGAGCMNNNSNILLNVKVIGLGPWFTLQITLKNMGKVHISFIALIVMFNDTFYKINRAILKIPLLVPNQNYIYDIKVKCIEANGNSDPIKFALINDIQSNNNKNKKTHFPFMTAIVDMPYADMEE